MCPTSIDTGSLRFIAGSRDRLRELLIMLQLWTYAIVQVENTLASGWFWLFPLLFAVHDAEEAAAVWIVGSLHNSISYKPLDVLQTLVAISLELTIFAAVAAWAAESDTSRLAIFVFAVFLGGYTAHGFFHLYMGWRAKRYTMGVASALPLVVFGGLLIYAKLIQTGMLDWSLAFVSFAIGALLMLPLIRLARWFGLTFG